MNGDGIAAIVVSYDSEETLDDCLVRLRAAAGVAEIRVVDNASRDGSLDIVQRHALADPRLRFIANPDNPGFAVACNQGAADSRAPWLAFVNPDCLVEADSLARMRAHARSKTPAYPANASGISTPNHGRTPWEIGHPDLPRQRERPRVASPGGVLFPAFAKEAHAAQEFGKTSQRNSFSALKHPGARLPRPRQGRGCDRRMCAAW